MKLSAKAVWMLTLLEGRRARPYKDAAGNWTIGIGHLISSGEGHLLKAYLADDEIFTILQADLYAFEFSVLEACSRSGLMPSQTQFDALVLLAFNIGVEGFLTSTVFRRFINADLAGAASAFLMWNKITIDDRKIASRALEARRIAESRVFLHGYYDETPYNSLDDAERIKAFHIPSNTKSNPTNIVPSASEARPNLKNSRTMIATVMGQGGGGVVAAGTTLGVVKSVADQAKSAADSAGAAVQSVNEAASAAGATVGLFANTSILIYGVIGAGALVAITAFIVVRRARRDDWRRGLR